MSYPVGQKVVLIEEYNGYPAGTALYYVRNVLDSGSNVPLCIIDNERTREGMKSFGCHTIEEAIELIHKDAYREHSIAHIYFGTIKPWPKMIKSLEEINSEYDLYEKRLSILAKQREWATA